MDFRRALPDAWGVFFRNRQPRSIQAVAIPELIRGRSGFLSAPTASGKTEAVLAPLYQRHTSFSRDCLSVVYVGPTKALVNDMYERLLGYFGAANPDLIARYTGDHHDYADATGRFILLATPEALDSLQLTRAFLLKGVRAVFVDEAHLLDGTARGQQLRSVIARVRANARSVKDPRDVFQVVGVTATVQDISAVATRWCGQDAVAVTAGDPREIDFADLDCTNRPQGAVLAAHIRQADAKKFLIFARTRNQAHELAADLNERLSADGYPVYLHIGILSKAERERIEAAMKGKGRGICIATSTLEVGIDIGDIDVVGLLEPPISVNSFLQRIGRGNRRTGTCIVWGCRRNARDSNLYGALLQCARAGYLDDVNEYWRPSVDFQQILSLAWWGVRANSPLTRQNMHERSGGSVREETLEDMLATEAIQNHRGALIPSAHWYDVGEARKIHSVIVGPSGLPLVDLATGEQIGAAGTGGLRGRIFAGTRITAVRGSDDAGVYVSGAHGRPGALARLPGTRGRKTGVSRPVMWGLAESGRKDPRRWQRAADGVTTWGGADYNTLLAHVVGERLGAAVTSDEYGLGALPSDAKITPATVLEWATEAKTRGPVPQKIARKFRAESAFFTSLSPELQRVEIQNSVPWDGLLAWLRSLDGQ